MAQFVDWDLAAATAGALGKSGPRATRAEANEAVGQLRDLADQAAGHVEAYTGMSPVGRPAPVRVVDRRGWAGANIDGLRQVVSPLLARVAGVREVGPVADAVGSRVAGVQAGTVLAYLSGRVLGQYEVFSADPGQLLLVAPNIVEVERRLESDPRDFRLWVCLHEVTHRTQFTAVPWLRGHFLGEVAAFVDAGGAPDQMAERVRHAVGAVADLVRNPESRASVLDLVQTPGQRAVLDRITALMTLLEGHAEFVMDGVGPEVVPSVNEIRSQVRPASPGGQPGGEAGPAAARDRREAAPVRRGAAICARRGVGGGHGRVQPGVEVAADAAPARRVDRPGRVDLPGRRASGVSGPGPPRCGPTRRRLTVAAVHPAVAAIRGALRATLASPGGLLLVACSGGADSLALATAAAFVAPRLGWRAGLVTVDHQLQAGSAERARDVAEWAGKAGLTPVIVETVEVSGRPGGPEAAARDARYEALVRAAAAHGATTVLLGHTRDDQAETVLLALLRGAGPRGMAGMPARREIDGITLLRPLLGVSREQTLAACAALGLTVWDDPHNSDRAFGRARARTLIRSLVDELGPAVVPNLARTAHRAARRRGRPR